MSVILWFILFAISWPLALILLIAYPIIWLLLLPFRLIGITVGSLFKLIEALLMLPFRMVRGSKA
ncbi:MAG: hypothetical protein ACNS62_19940 [Candidatus Cyclobacteriaceae bacterium M3_2C_046]